MQTQPLTKSDLLKHLKELTDLVEKDLCDEGTISWNKTAFGTYEVIALAMAVTSEGVIPLTIGDVNG